MLLYVSRKHGVSECTGTRELVAENSHSYILPKTGIMMYVRRKTIGDCRESVHELNNSVKKWREYKQKKAI